MITFQVLKKIKEDRRIVLDLPAETPLGDADLVVTIEPRRSSPEQAGSLRRHFGAVRGGDVHSADNERIDLDLSRAYENLPDETR